MNKFREYTEAFFAASVIAVLIAMTGLVIGEAENVAWLREVSNKAILISIAGLLISGVFYFCVSGETEPDDES